MEVAVVVGDLIQQDEASGRERGVRGSGSGSALSLLISVAPRPASQQSSSLILIRVLITLELSPALNYRRQIYGLINVNNLVLSRFTAPKLQANRKVGQRILMYPWIARTISRLFGGLF